MRRYSFSLMLYLSAAYGMEKNEDDYLRKLPNDIIVTHICSYIFFPEQPNSEDDLRSLLRFSKTSKKNYSCVQRYIERSKKSLNLLTSLLAEQENALSGKPLSESQKNHVACMNLLAEIIVDEKYDLQAEFYSLCLLEKIKKGKHDINDNFQTFEYVKPCINMIVATYGSIMGYSYYTWCIPRIPLIEACRKQKVSVVLLLLKYGCKADYAHYRYENSLGTHVCSHEHARGVA